MSYLLFQAGFAVYFVAAVIYTVFFFSQKAQIRIVARIVFVLAASLHTLNIIFRYIEAGHTPITSIHETISFFAWSIACCHLSFRWRYTVKIPVPLLDYCPATDAGIFVGISGDPSSAA